MTSMTQFDGTAITYTYSATANDGKLVSQVTGSETVNYTYDSLGRLSQAATAGAGGWGNRLQQAAVKGSVPTITTITDPATNRIQAHTYDANGNTVNTPLQGAMTYDVLNRLTTVASDTYGYDPSNKRVWKNDEFTFWGAGGERIGRYTVAKLVDSTSAHVFVFQKVSVDEYFGGRRLTTQDRLGSVGSYYPYGEAKSGSVSNADSFANYYRDSTGLDYADQRYFGPNVGRFVSADDSYLNESVAIPSSWNRYTYVEGDPINFVDPEGLATCRDTPLAGATPAGIPSGITIGQLLGSSSAAIAQTDIAALAVTIYTESGYPSWSRETNVASANEMAAIAMVIMNRFTLVNGDWDVLAGPPGSRMGTPVRTSDFGAANGTIGGVVFARGQFEPWSSAWNLNRNAAQRLDSALNSQANSGLCDALVQSIATAAGFWGDRDRPGFWSQIVPGGGMVAYLGFSAAARGNEPTKAFYEVWMGSFGGGFSGGNQFSGVYLNQIVARGSASGAATGGGGEGVRGGGGGRGIPSPGGGGGRGRRP
jgi:RHS repeat-associated protein